MSLYVSRRWPVVEKKCSNRACAECGITQELAAFEEFGRLFLVDEDDLRCRECGEEMSDVYP